jgi:hypothetical protein
LTILQLHFSQKLEEPRMRVVTCCLVVGHKDEHVWSVRQSRWLRKSLNSVKRKVSDVRSFFWPLIMVDTHTKHAKVGVFGAAVIQRTARALGIIIYTPAMIRMV